MRIILIRHGETVANTFYGTDSQILIGAMDNELTLLTDKGKEQAFICKQNIESSNFFPVDRVYSSDLMRTKQTSEIVFPNRTIVYDKRLRERSLGVAEGIRINEIPKYEDINKACVKDEDELEVKLTKRQINGENYYDVYERLSSFLNDLDFSENVTIAIVCHFHVIRCFRYILNNKKFDEHIFEMLIDNAKPLFFEYQDNAFVEIKE